MTRRLSERLSRSSSRLSRVTLSTSLLACLVLSALGDTGWAAIPPAKTQAGAKAHAGKKSQAKTKSKSAKASTKRQPAKAKMARVPLDPPALIASRAQKVMTKLKSRPLLPVSSGAITEVAAEASKGSWLSAIYERDMVEADWASEMLADKRILFEVLARELGEKATSVYPKTLGLREFLFKHKLVKANGEIAASGEKIEEALFSEFPAGFVVRPAVGVAPVETGRGLFADTDGFIVELLRVGNPMYQASFMKNPVKSHILGSVASGEAVVLQENVVLAADARKKLKGRFFSEARIHTYENRVIEGAVPSRWVQKNLLSEEDVKRAEAFVNEALKSLPLALLSKQAWGVDVAVMDNGDMRIVDVITNRGKRVAWSSYLEQPRVIGAYARHFEAHYGMKFTGVAGSLIRNNFANYVPYWEKRIDKSQPGLSKAMAYLPPLP